MDSLDPQALKEFQEEAIELLNVAEAELLAVERGKALSQAFGAVFRAFHSLKGAAGMLGLRTLESQVHELEAQLNTHKGQDQISPQRLDYFLKGIQTTQDILQGSATPSTTLPNPKSDPKGPTIFLVDDEPDILEIVSELLQEYGYHSQGFTSAPSALECYTRLPHSERPALIVSDFNMPVMNGLDFLKSIRQLSPLVGFIFLSGYLDRNHLKTAIELGASAVVDKPVRADTLIPTIASQNKKFQLESLLDQSLKLLLAQYGEVDKALQTTQPEIAKKLKVQLKTLFHARRAAQSSYPNRNPA